jgi:hypothetical protein
MLFGISGRGWYGAVPVCPPQVPSITNPVKMLIGISGRGWYGAVPVCPP